jgi:hypothetical protein
MDDPRADALIETTASVLVGLVVAHRRGDCPAMMTEIGKLLTAVAQYSATPVEKRDAALWRAIERGGN